LSSLWRDTLIMKSLKDRIIEIAKKYDMRYETTDRRVLITVDNSLFIAVHLSIYEIWLAENKNGYAMCLNASDIRGINNIMQEIEEVLEEYRKKGKITVKARDNMAEEFSFKEKVMSIMHYYHEKSYRGGEVGEGSNDVINHYTVQEIRSLFSYEEWNSIIAEEWSEKEEKE